MSTPDPRRGVLGTIFGRRSHPLGSKENPVKLGTIFARKPLLQDPQLQALMKTPFVRDTLMRLFPNSEVRSLKDNKDMVLGLVYGNVPDVAHIAKGRATIPGLVEDALLRFSPKAIPDSAEHNYWNQRNLSGAYRVHMQDAYNQTGESILQHELAHTLDMGSQDPELVEKVVSNYDRHVQFVKDWHDNAVHDPNNARFVSPGRRPLTYSDSYAASDPREFFAEAFRVGMSAMRRASSVVEKDPVEAARLLKEGTFIPGSEEVVKWALTHPIFNRSPLRQLMRVDTDWRKWFNADLSDEQIDALERGAWKPQ